MAVGERNHGEPGPARGARRLFVEVTGVETVTERQRADVERRDVGDDAVSDYLDAMTRADGLDDALGDPEVE